MKMPVVCCLVMCSVLGLFSAAAAEEPVASALREGDIVFSGSISGQGGAIIAATGSPYTHCGILFLNQGKLMVLEAVQPVGVVSLDVFRSRSKPGVFTVRRLKAALTPAMQQVARAWAEAQIGKDYDARFLWDDGRFYCSELVWKVYQHAGVELCEPRRFRDYHLDDPKVKKLIEERFGSVGSMPPEEKVVTPCDLAISPLLTEVPPGS